MSRVIVSVFEGEPLPDFAVDPRVLIVEDVPFGTGTASRRRYTLEVTDSRFWLTDEQKRTEPLVKKAAA